MDAVRRLRRCSALVTISVRPLTFYLDRDLAMHRFRALLLLFFGVAALFLAAIGVAAVTAYGVSRRVPEIGLRIALGATPGNAVTSIMRPLVRVTLVGVMIGVAGSMAAGQLLGSFLVGVEPHDPVVLLSVPLVIFSAALVGSWIPARRAAEVDPAVALRGE